MKEEQYLQKNEFLWGIVSAAVMLISFIGALYFWRRCKKEEDPYYIYGDSLYQGDLGDVEIFKTPEEIEEYQNRNRSR